MLLLAFHRGAVPLQFHVGQHFTGSESVIHQRHSLVQGHGEDEGFVGTLAGRLTRLRISRYRHNVFELLNQHFIFVTFHVDVTDGIGSEGTSSDVTLGLTVDADIAGRWHDLLLDMDKDKMSGGRSGNSRKHAPLLLAVQYQYIKNILLYFFPSNQAITCLNSGKILPAGQVLT